MSEAAGGLARFGLIALLALALGALLLSSANPAGAQVVSADVDYDSDDDNLIEVSTLDQLNAIRYDLDGDGAVASGSQPNYDSAFPNAASGMGCAATCLGYELTADLDFDTNGSGTANAGDAYWNGGVGWESLGDDSAINSTTRYNAVFDGNGHTISNLFFNRTSTDRGLFGATSATSVVRNVGLVGTNVTGGNYTGALIGTSYGTVDFAYSTGSVTGSQSVGGLVGYVDHGAIQRSYSTASVTGSKSNNNAGGLAGQVSNGVVIKASYATGAVDGGGTVGGLVGNSRGNITASYATGTVTGTDSNQGGLVGSHSTGTITDSYWDVTTSTQADDSDDSTGVGKTTSELQTPEDYGTGSAIYANWNLDLDGDSSTGDDPWDFGSNAMYPALKADFDGDGTATSYEFGGSAAPVAPAFTEGAGPVSRSVPENTEKEAEKSFGLPVAATDGNDQDTLIYTLGGTNASHFDIDASSGQLQARGALDFESGTTSYQVTVSVRDGRDADGNVEASPAADATIVVNIPVTDVANEAAAADRVNSGGDGRIDGDVVKPRIDFDSFDTGAVKEDSKIEWGVRQVIKDSGATGGRGRRSAPDAPLITFTSGMADADEDGNLHLYIVTGDTGDAALSALRNLGVRIEIVNEELGIIQAWAPSANVEAIAELGFVKRIRTPDYSAANTGSVTSEGDAILNADDVRNLGFTGAGIRVGVLSDGVQSMALAQATNDLPAVIERNPAFPGVSGDEGTAMLEIVHDLAPDARLAFTGGSDGLPSTLEKINGINWLATQAFGGNGADVIVDDITNYNEPFFEDGPVARAAQRASDSGALYVHSAGNFRNGLVAHYVDSYRPTAPLGLHDFDSNPARSDVLMTVLIQEEQPVSVFLQWNDAFGASGNDYDLYLCPPVERISLDDCGKSENVQDGDDDPYEAVGATARTGSNITELFVLIRGVVDSEGNVPDVRQLKLIVRNGFMGYHFSRNTIFGVSAVTDVISVNAIDASDPGHDSISENRAQGPAEIYHPRRETRPKPDLVGIEGTLITGAGGFGYLDPVTNQYKFPGTSAAAPHVAGVAALALQKIRTAEPGIPKVRARRAAFDILLGTAVDLGVRGRDALYGEGRVDALNAINAINAPSFDAGGIVTYTVAENTASGVNIGAALTATDPDAGAALTYTLGGTDSAHFALTGNQLQTKGALDYEGSKNSYSVTVTVSDGGLIDTIDVTINVTDVNEAPAFDAGASKTYTVAENLAANTNIGPALTVTDPDAGASLTYALSGTDASMLNIHADTGALSFKAPPNYEAKNLYSATATVSDGTLTDTIDVTINITNVNEPPSFTAGGSATRSVAENTAGGVNIGNALAASDPDAGDSLTYTLGGADSSHFALSGSRLQTKGALDYESKTSYSVTVTATDSGKLTDTIAVTINVTDANEPPAVPTGLTAAPALSALRVSWTAPDMTGKPPVSDYNVEYKLQSSSAWSSHGHGSAATNTRIGSLTAGSAYHVRVQAVNAEGQSGWSASASGTPSGPVGSNNPPTLPASSISVGIPENTAADVSIGNALAADDTDGDTLTYALGGTDSGHFALVGNQLKTKGALDYEGSKTSYEVVVTVSDGKGGSDSITITINVLNVNEAPSFDAGSSAAYSIAENTAAAANIGAALAATDPDFGAALSYTLGGTDSAHFALAGNQLRTKNKLDYEDKTSYRVTVTVSDGSLSDVIAVTINVTDVDEPPGIPRSLTVTPGVEKLSVSWNAPGDMLDKPAISGYELQYGRRISTGPDAWENWRGHSETGGSTNRQIMGLTNGETYRVRVRARNAEGDSDWTAPGTGMPAAATVTNNAPAFPAASVTLTMPENTAANTPISGSPRAADADTGDTLTYALSGADAGELNINTGTGALSFKAPPDYEADNSYSVTVTATDRMGAADSIDVTINVTNVNEAPSFTAGGSSTFFIAENTAPDTDIGSPLEARDPDGDALTYALEATGDHAHFALSGSQLKTKGALDYESKARYGVTVTASDGTLTGAINVVVIVLDVNETGVNAPPSFIEGATASRSVAENTPSGQDIGSPVSASDVDRDILTYAIDTSAGDHAHFAIDSATGQLKTKGALDYEEMVYAGKESYSITVTVSDGNGGSDSIGVTITVTDVKDTLAFDDGTTVDRRIPSGTPAGTNVGAPVTATDADGRRAGLVYSVHPFSTKDAPFRVDRNTGQVQTTAEVTAGRRDDLYRVVLQVRDQSGSVNYIWVSIWVTKPPPPPPPPVVTPPVVDPLVNRAPAFVFDGAVMGRSVAENTPAGAKLGSPVQARDPDGDVLTYGLTGRDAADFDLDSDTGQMRAKAHLDYEKARNHKFTITVNDGRGGSDWIHIVIFVTNVDETPPAFTEGATAGRSVAENTPAGQDIGLPLEARDVDRDPLTYALGGTDAGHFALSGNQLQTSGALDYESRSSYSVTVTVGDGTGGTDSIEATITVTDVAEAPVFTEGATAGRSVAENTVAGQDIGLPLEATDAEGDSLSYTLGGTDAGHFALSGNQLQTSGALDYESRSSYSVTVTVGDGNGGSDSIDVTITVTDVNEAAPIFTEGATAGRSVAENTAAGQDIGLPLAATDAEGDPLTYALGGTDAGHFALSGNQLQTSGALDYEGQSSYSVTVTVSDGKSGTDSIDVTITVTDVNEAPVFTEGGSAARSVVEHTIAGKDIGLPLAATDAEGDALTYTLGGTDAGHFGLSGNQLRTSGALDYEGRSSYSVTVTVGDGMGGMDSIDVTITVTDVNEAPAFTEGASAARSVAEHTIAGKDIGLPLVVIDPDGDSLTYALGGADGGHFALSGSQLQTSGALDYEDRSSYSVTMTVSDGNGGTDSIDVSIIVTDVEEPATLAFDEGVSADRRIPSGTPAGANVGAPVTATGPDGRAGLVYSVYYRGPADDYPFRVDRNTGQVQTTAEVTAEGSDGLYTIVLRVRDRSRSSHYTWVSILVTKPPPPPVIAPPVVDPPVVDPLVNRAPAFDRVVMGRNVPENTPPGAKLGSPVRARDADGDTLTYSLVGRDAADFDLDSATGQMRAKARLDYENTREHKFTINVSDGRGGTDFIHIVIFVTDVDETAAPAFTEGASASRSVAENTAAGQDIGLPLAATDADRDPLTYALGGTDAGHFVLSGNQLRTSGALDYEGQSSYSVTVTVSDGKGGTDRIEVTITVTDVDEPPGQPAAPEVIDIEETSFRVTWTAPAAGSSAITGYGIQYKPQAAADSAYADVTPAHTGTATSYHLADRSGQTVADGTSYAVRVRAGNAMGWGPWSDPAIAVTASANPPPNGGGGGADDGRDEEPANGAGSYQATAHFREGYVTVSWDDVDGAEYHLVEKNGQLMPGRYAATTFNDGDVEEGTRYEYRITAYDGEDNVLAVMTAATGE